MNMPDARYKQFKVSNYKNLKSCTLAVDDIAILVGANNSGKSNFLSIFSILNRIFSKGRDGKRDVAVELFLHHPKAKLDATKIEIDYSVAIDGDICDASYLLELVVDQKDFSLVINKESIYYKASTSTGPSKRLFEREKGTLKIRNEGDSNKAAFKEYHIAADASVVEIIASIIPEIAQQSEFQSLLNPVLAAASSHLFKTHELSGNYISEISNILPALDSLQRENDPSFNKFKQSFLSILDLDDFSISEFTPPEKVERKFFFCFVKEKHKNTFTPIGMVSDGTRILVLMLYHLFISKCPLLLIDEPETGLHPKALSKLFEILQNKLINKQVVMTTHSSFLLNLVNPKNVTLVEVSEDGTSTFKPVSEIDDIEKRLRSKYVNFGDLFADNFKAKVDTSL